MDNNINDIGSANSEVVQSTRKTSHLTTANNCGGLSKVHPILLQQQHPPLLDSRLFLVDQCAHSTGSSAKEVKANHPSNMDASTTLSGSGIAVEEEKTNDNPDQKWLESSDDLFRDDDLCDICYEDDDNDSQDPDKILFACGEDMDLSDSGSKEEISLGGDGVGRDRSTTTPPFVSSSSTAILTMGEFGEQHISAYSAAGGALEKWKQPRTTNNSRSTSWHNEATDRPYRQCIILEIARLLQARKSALPSNGWLQELPHKARKLEGRLYSISSSLEEYQDRSTLKVRLKKLASVIMRQFRSTRKPLLSLAPRNNSSTTPSAMTSLSTTASQRQRHEKVASTSDRSELSIHSLLGNETLSAAVATTDNGEFRFTVAPMAQGQLASNVLDSGSQRLFATAPYGPGDFLGSVSHGQSASTLLSGTTPLDNGPSFYQNNHLINNTTNAVPASFADHRLRVIPPEQRVSLSVRSSHSVNELERQKTLNTLLQEQIQDNIRRQEDLVRRLMANEPDSVGAIPERQPGSGPYSVSNSNEQNATMLAVMHRNSVSSVNDTSSISDANRHVAMSNHPAVMNAPGIITSNQPQLSNDLSSCLLASKGPISSNMLQNRQLPGQLPIDAPQYGNAFAGFGQQRLLHPNYVQIQPPTFPTINNSMNGIDDSNTMIGNSTSGPQYHMNHQQLPNMGFVTNANVWNVDEIQRQGFSGLKPSSDT